MSEEFNRSTEKATTTPIASSSASRGAAFDLSMLNRPASQKTNGVSSAQVYICWNASATGTVRETTLSAGSRWSASLFAAVSTASTVQNANTPNSSARLIG